MPPRRPRNNNENAPKDHLGLSTRATTSSTRSNARQGQPTNANVARNTRSRNQPPPDPFVAPQIPAVPPRNSPHTSASEPETIEGLDHISKPESDGGAETGLSAAAGSTGGTPGVWRSFPNRPAEECAADSRHWRNSSSIAFQFLVIIALQEDPDGRFISATLQCAICHSGSQTTGQYIVNRKSKTSTGNYFNHFSSSHTEWWGKVTAADQKRHYPMSVAIAGPHVVRFNNKQMCCKSLNSLLFSHSQWKGH